MNFENDLECESFGVALVDLDGGTAAVIELHILKSPKNS